MAGAGQQPELLGFAGPAVDGLRVLLGEVVVGRVGHHQGEGRGDSAGLLLGVGHALAHLGDPGAHGHGQEPPAGRGHGVTLDALGGGRVPSPPPRRGADGDHAGHPPERAGVEQDGGAPETDPDGNDRQGGVGGLDRRLDVERLLGTHAADPTRGAVAAQVGHDHVHPTGQHVGEGVDAGHP